MTYDAIIDDERRKNSFGLVVSLNMLIETEFGFNYTGADCKAWMKEAGFRETHRAAPRRSGFDGRRHQVGADEVFAAIHGRARSHPPRLFPMTR